MFNARGPRLTAGSATLLGGKEWERDKEDM